MKKPSYLSQKFSMQTYRKITPLPSAQLLENQQNVYAFLFFFYQINYISLNGVFLFACEILSNI